MAEWWDKLGTDIAVHTVEHLFLTVVSLGLAAAVAIPVGVMLARTRHQRVSSGVLGAAALFQTIPSLAMLALMLVLFLLINHLWGGAQWYEEGGLLPTVGVLPAIAALVLYALLPILRNTYTGIRQVDPAVIEVATAMGMTRRQVLLKIELPLALPVIMSGVRISAVWTIGVATLCALVGAGGLGDLIMIGLRSYKIDYLIAGTIPAALLALVFDGTMSLLERWLTPAGLRDRSRE